MNYLLFIVGAYLVINGLVIGSQAPTALQQIGAILHAGFGVLAIGLGALIGIVKTGLARLEKRLSSAPKARASSEQPPSRSEETPMLDRLAGSRIFDKP